MQQYSPDVLILAGLFALASCNSATEKQSQIQPNTMEMTVTADTLKKVLDAFNRHDLDAIMEYFSEDCTFDFPRGPEYYGQRFVGKTAVREGLASRFKGIPDVHYGEDIHFVSADGDRGLSEWTLTGTTTAGVKIKVRGCDLWTFRDGKIIRKDAFWKIIEPSNTSASK